MHTKYVESSIQLEFIKQEKHQPQPKIQYFKKLANSFKESVGDM